jgi:hypothetical protein
VELDMTEQLFDQEYVLLQAWHLDLIKILLAIFYLIRV